MDNNTFVKQLYLIVSDMKGNHPFLIDNIIPEYKPTQDNISFLDEIITNGSYFLSKLDDEKYIKTYRIEEACLRTLKELKAEGFNGKSLEMIEKNPYILHDELERWINSNHNSMLSYVVDKYWHNFVLYAKEYENWCTDKFNCFYYHTPRFPYENEQMSDEEILLDIIKFFKLYSKLYPIDERVLLYNFPLLLSKNNIDNQTIYGIINELINE